MADHQPDLHVVSLRYSVHHSDDVTYDNPPPVEFETDEARFRLADRELTCEMKVHFSTDEEARRTIEPTLTAWEADVVLHHRRRHLRFEFEDANVEDRAPRPPGELVVSVGGTIRARASLTASLHGIRREYPPPPASYFRLNPDAESILRRYEGYLDGREHLQGMAYWCVTLANVSAGGGVKDVKAAAKKYRISRAVLETIKKLASARGDRLTARKADVVQPLTGAERTWLEEAVKILIWRVGDTRDPAPLPEITMTNLPKL
jgi:hypothetical protein